MRRIGIVAALAASLAAAAMSARPQVGQPATDFTLTTFDGRKVTLDELRGQVVVLNFWATWCVPCKRELPLLDAYYRHMRGSGLRVFAIATQDSLMPSQLKPLANVVSIPFAKGIRGGYDALNAVPTNFVIDRRGVLRYAKAAAFTLDDLNAILVPLLNEPAPEAVTRTPAS